MKHIAKILPIALLYFIMGCSEDRLEEKGFSVSTTTSNEEDKKVNGIASDSLKLETKPSSVLLTGNSNYRLTTVFKININKENNTTFIGSNNYHVNYGDFANEGENNWHYNFMPGLEAIYGYNLVNVSLYNIDKASQQLFFDKPVLIKTLYFPSFSIDTLKSLPVNRNYYMVSVYDDDTNKDGYINVKDLRRFYLFDIDGNKQKELVPGNYSVYKSEYDSANDLMMVFAQLDENNNGRRDEYEPIHVFWIDLKDPTKTGRLY